MSVATKPKSAARAAKPAESIGQQLLADLVEPFRWKVHTGGLLGEQLLLINSSMTIATDDKPLYDTVWTIIDFPSGIIGPGLYKSSNDAKAMARALCPTRKALNAWNEFARNGASDTLLQTMVSLLPKETQTASGAVYVQTFEPGECVIWFGRKAGKKEPDLFIPDVVPAVRALFNIPEPVKGKAKVRRVDPQHNEQPADKPAVAKQPAGKSKAAAATLQNVAIENIQSSPDNHRKSIDAGELQQLADSIRQHGILLPLLLRPLDAGRFEIIDGERRFRAATIAGLYFVPAQIVDRGGLQASLAMWEANVRRVDLSPIERAQAIRGFMDAHGLKQTEVAKIAGVSQGQISNELRLLQLPAEWQQKVSSGEVAATAIRPALPFADCPGVFAALEVEMERWKDLYGSPLTETEFRRSIESAIDKASRSMRFEKNSNAWQAPRKEERHFETVSAADLKRLDVRKVGCDGRLPEDCRAFNLDLFDQLNAGPLAVRLKKYQAKQKAEKAARTKSGNAKTKSGVFAADGWKLKPAFDNTLRPLFADALKSTKNKLAAQRVCLIMAIMQQGDLSELVSGVRAFDDGFFPAVVSAMEGTCLVQMVETIRAACLKSLSNDHHWILCGQMLELAKVLGVDLLQRWKPSCEVIEMLTPNGLEECCRAIEYEGNAKHAEAIVAAWPGGFVPDFFREPLGIAEEKPKAKPKKGGAV